MCVQTGDALWYMWQVQQRTLCCTIPLDDGEAQRPDLGDILTTAGRCRRRCTVQRRRHKTVISHSQHPTYSYGTHLVPLMRTCGDSRGCDLVVTGVRREWCMPYVTVNHSFSMSSLVVPPSRRPTNRLARWQQSVLAIATAAFNA